MANKFRISLSLEHIDFIMATPDCPPDLYKILDLVKYKVGSGNLTPAFNVKKDLASSLTKDQGYRLACRKLDSGLPLDPPLKKAYDQYRYENDLMTPEEESEYESQALSL